MIGRINYIFVESMLMRRDIHIKATLRALRGMGLEPPHLVQEYPPPKDSGFSCPFIKKIKD